MKYLGIWKNVICFVVWVALLILVAKVIGVDESNPQVGLIMLSGIVIAFGGFGYDFYKTN
jgi:hypothetical protein